jgi:hypothetical protein
MIGDKAPKCQAETDDDANEADSPDKSAADVIALDELQATECGDSAAEEYETDGFHLRKQMEHQPLSTAQWLHWLQSTHLRLLSA